MSYHGSALIYFRDDKNTISSTMNTVSSGMKLCYESLFTISNKFSKYLNDDWIDISNEKFDILDYDYDHLTRLLKIHINYSNFNMIRIYFDTPESLEKNHINVFSNDQKVLMLDNSFKLGNELNIGDEIKGVCGFKSIITGIEQLTIKTTSYDLVTDSGTFYIHGMPGISYK